MVIRCPVHDIRIARRPSQGVVVFKVGDGERVVSVARLGDMGEENGGEENGGAETGGEPPENGSATGGAPPPAGTP